MKPFPKDLSALTLRLLAMGFMLLDHMWATIVPGQDWMTWVGRLAFPIFAFLLAEGCRHTRNFRKYLGRMALFALISEIPFDLMAYGYWLFPFHQNVLWTFCIALLAMKSLDIIRERCRLWLSAPLSAGVVFASYLVGEILMTDYSGSGVLMVLVFYFLKGSTWPQRLGQLAALYYINFQLLGSMQVPVELFGISFDFPHQGMAIFALALIWCYRGRQGAHTKPIQYLGYWFYPVHALILGLLNG